MDGSSEIEKLIPKSQWLRKSLFQMAMRAQKGHIPSSFSCVEILISLFYGGILKTFPNEPRHPERDRLFISKGQAAMAIYPILCDLGFAPNNELQQFASSGALFRVYADPSIPLVEAVTGSLGNGFGIACGHALAAKLNGESHRVFVILGDGEINEGSVWESALFSAHHQLSNLTVILDRNRQCILGDTEEHLSLEPLEKKWTAFGWDTLVVNGHSYQDLLGALKKTQKSQSPPTPMLDC